MGRGFVGATVPGRPYGVSVRATADSAVARQGEVDKGTGDLEME